MKKTKQKTKKAVFSKRLAAKLKEILLEAIIKKI